MTTENKIWCAMCGKWGDHGSGTCPELKPDFLPTDVARCDGSGSVENGVQYWREGCENCLRRTAPRSERCTMMAPPPIIAFFCEYLIEAGDALEGRIYHE